jgi:hypothetical protein
MTTEEEVCAAAMVFYDGINDMVSGKGLDRIRQAWEHGAHVTAGHPSGEWAQGWDEIVAGFEIFQSLGRHDRGGSAVRGMRAHVYGDLAYTTCLFTSAPAFGGERFCRDFSEICSFCFCSPIRTVIVSRPKSLNHSRRGHRRAPAPPPEPDRKQILRPDRANPLNPTGTVR